jgi:hypothetical protein
MITYKLNNEASLISNFAKQDKPFVSKRECRKPVKVELIKDNADREYIQSYGLLIVKHKERLEPYKIVKTKKNKLYYDYFEKNKDCVETQSFYDKNPKILRYWTRYRTVNKKPGTVKKDWKFY